MVRWNEQKATCDQCGRKLSIPDLAMQGDPLPLPHPWHEIWLIGWAGTFVVCSPKCEEGLRQRYARPEPKLTILLPGPPDVAPEDEQSERPTLPDIPSYKTGTRPIPSEEDKDPEEPDEPDPDEAA